MKVELLIKANDRNKQAAKYAKKGGDFNTASEMSDGELAANSEKTEDEIKNQKGKTQQK